MPTREEAPNGAPCWIDLMTSDTESSQAFYGQLFGWTAGPPSAELGGYLNFSKDGIAVAGCVASSPDSAVSNLWSVYLASDDAEKTADAAGANGGRVFFPAVEVGDLGSMALLGDAGGAAIGVWQPGRHKGFGIHGEPGTPAWFELQTREYDASVEFYHAVFHWDTHVTSDTPEFRYTTLGSGDDQLAGIMDASGFLPEDVRPSWSVYFSVEDIDAALAKVVELGGSIVAPAEDTPYGRLAEAADSTGAHFKLVGGM